LLKTVKSSVSFQVSLLRAGYLQVSLKVDHTAAVTNQKLSSFGVAGFVYKPFVEWYPANPIYPSISLSPGTNVSVYVQYDPYGSQVDVQLEVGNTWWTGPNWTITSQDVPYVAQFILETPTTNGAYDYLPYWSGNMNQVNPTVICNNGAWEEMGSWFFQQGPGYYQSYTLAPRGVLDAHNAYYVISPGVNEFEYWTYQTSQ